ncbi:MAG TPA: dolichol kinase [Ignavibacteriales bacterium]|mgnify:CR=1 FL=1|nr:dolichol kinase [Ignavibacteriales bacterium]HOM65692.1 dolichol kinase [Ignavibacteriales bacterium]HPD67388.1 dolichol kinase [Ignavibacteriales bacterium]HPP32913.1 dolichol kinase [Ignavibacteriales bacterium]HRR18769.1 dolichol kinase [Ignavibacteriales bacterium]
MIGQIQNIDYRSEVLRKLIHLTSLLIPIIYWFIPKDIALYILVPMTIFAVFMDIGRFYIPFIRRFVNYVFGFMLREHEKDLTKRNLNGASYVLLSAVLCVAIFPKIIFVTAFSILIVSDTMAALIGRRFGKTKFLMKSLEGSLAFFVSAMVVVLLSPKVRYSIDEYIIGFIAGFLAMIAENISYGWADDNFLIPLTAGFTIWGLYLLVGIAL